MHEFVVRSKNLTFKIQTIAALLLFSVPDHHKWHPVEGMTVFEHGFQIELRLVQG